MEDLEVSQVHASGCAPQRIRWSDDRPKKSHLRLMDARAEDRRVPVDTAISEPTPGLTACLVQLK